MSDNQITRLFARRGDTVLWNFVTTRVTDATTNPLTTTPIDLTSAQIVFTVKSSLMDADSDSLLQVSTLDEITITNAVAGQYTVKLPPAATSSFDDMNNPTNEYWFDIQITLGATNGQYESGDVITVTSGILTVGTDRTLTLSGS